MTEMNNTEDNYAAPHRTFTESIEVGFAKYFDFNGRASRTEFWWFQLFLTLTSWGFIVAEAATRYSMGIGPADGFDWIDVIAEILPALFFIIPTIAVCVRRLHDTGRDGWRLLLVLTGFGLLPLVYWWARPSDPNKNEYDE